MNVCVFRFEYDEVSLIISPDKFEINGWNLAQCIVKFMETFYAIHGSSLGLFIGYILIEK